jgi:hypothetical protein
LDGANRLTHVALLLALRQDALAATDTPPTSRNRLVVAETLSKFTAADWPYGDWPLVIYISGAGDRPYEVKSEIQNDPRYLAIAYPKIFGDLIAKYSGADLPGAFLYAVIRHGLSWSWLSGISGLPFQTTAFFRHVGFDSRHFRPIGHFVSDKPSVILQG